MNGPLFAAGFLLIAGPLLFAGNLLKNGDFSRGTRFWNANFAMEAKEKTLLLDLPDGNAPGKRLMNQAVDLKDRTWHRLSFRLQSEKAGIFRAVYQLRSAPYSILGLERNFAVTPGTQECSVLFRVTRGAEQKGQLLFNLTRLPGRTVLSEVRLEALAGVRDLSVGELDGAWLAFPDGNTDNAPGVPVSLKNGRIDLKELFPEQFRPNRSRILLRKRFSAEFYGHLPLTVFGDWFFDLSLNGKMRYHGTHANRFSPDAGLNLEVKPGENILEILVRAGADGWVCALESPRKPISFREDDVWKPYRFDSQEILPGSALDLSDQVERPAGKLGRLTISPEGELVFEKAPGRIVRLLGTNGIDPQPVPGETISREEFRREIRRFAQQARRLGYRIVRTHGYLDKMCENSGKDRRISPGILDRWDILIEEFKREGIYLHLTLLSFSLYTDCYSKTFPDRRFHKLMMYLDGEWEYETLRFAAETLFRHVNPYTGIAWKDDPVIAFVEYYNEQSLGLNYLSRTLEQYPEARKRARALFAEWQKKEYGKAECELPVGLKGQYAEREALFWQERARLSAERCGRIVRQAGYRGLVVPYSFSKMLGHGAARWEFAQVGDCHAYYNHPSNWSRPGSVVGAKSSIEEGADYWRSSFGTKLAGRPFIVSEYNHCFWNPFRYELGILFGGYSAFQGCGALMIHSGAVQVKPRFARLSCFCVGYSPLMRAGQFLTAQLFQRGDVRASPHRVVVNVKRDFLRRNGNAMHALDHTQTLLTLLAGFGVEYPEIPAAPGTVRPKADLRLAPAGVSHIFSQGWYSKIIANRNDSFSLGKTIEIMKNAGILSPDNRSSAKRRIFESDTGELLMNSPERMLLVTTPRTEAAAVPAGRTVSLKTTVSLRSSVDGCVALTSVDARRPLSESRRLVLLYQTEEANSGMHLGADRETLHFLGHNPSLCRTGKLELSLKLLPADWKLYALGLDGSRREEIPLSSRDGRILVRFHTGKLKSGPTTFFELAAESRKKGVAP